MILLFTYKTSLYVKKINYCFSIQIILNIEQQSELSWDIVLWQWQLMMSLMIIGITNGLYKVTLENDWIFVLWWKSHDDLLSILSLLWANHVNPPMFSFIDT